MAELVQWQLFFTLFYLMFVKIDQSYADGVGSSATDNAAYDTALVMMTFIPPMFMVVFVLYVGCVEV